MRKATSRPRFRNILVISRALLVLDMKIKYEQKLFTQKITFVLFSFYVNVGISGNKKGKSSEPIKFLLQTTSPQAIQSDSLLLQKKCKVSRYKTKLYRKRGFFFEIKVNKYHLRKRGAFPEVGSSEGLCRHGLRISKILEITHNFYLGSSMH